MLGHIIMLAVSLLCAMCLASCIALCVDKSNAQSTLAHNELVGQLCYCTSTKMNPHAGLCFSLWPLSGDLNFTTCCNQVCCSPANATLTIQARSVLASVKCIQLLILSCSSRVHVCVLCGLGTDINQAWCNLDGLIAGLQCNMCGVSASSCPVPLPT